MLLGLALIVVGLLNPGRGERANASTNPDNGTDVPASAADPEVIYEAFDTSAVSPKRPAPEIAVTTRSVALTGSALQVQATVTKTKAAGEILVLEEQSGDSWTAVASTRVGGDNTASLAVTTGDPATYRYRLWLASTTQHQERTSDEFSVEVIATPPELITSEEPAEPPDSPLCGDSSPKRADGSDWVCAYDDEFDGSSLDRRYWIAQQSRKSGFVTGSPTAPACVLDDPQTLAVADGRLSLKARVLDEPVTCGTTTSNQASGMVMQQGTFSQTYGKWEVRAKVPSWTGKGLQETFWLWPNDQLKYGFPHPASGEIDFAEFYSTYYYLVVPFMHYLFDPSTVSTITNTNIYTAHNCVIKVGEFNTYGLAWTPGLLRIFLNDKVCITNHYFATNAPEGSPRAPFDQPFFLALTQAFGTTGNEFDPATGPREAGTEVDYVRIWR